MQLRKKLTIFIAGLLMSGSLFDAASSLAAEKATLHERVAAQQQVEFDIFLPLQHRAQLEKLLADLHDSTSPRYHQWLTPDDFNRRFGARDNAVSSIVNELNAYGLKTERISSQQIHVHGDARAVEQIFLTELHIGKFRNGRQTIAAAREISLPGSMVANKAVVTGLSGFIRVHRHSQRAAAAAIPANRYSSTGPYWFDDLKQAYSYPSYQPYNGKGVTIGILMTGGYNPADMDLYFSHEKIATPKISEVDIAGGSPYDPNNSFETHLDLQQSGGMAPKAHLVLYNLPDLLDEHILAGLTKILDQNRADVVSMSFGGPEVGYQPAYNGGQDATALLGVYDDMFARGNAQGITFVASSGDAGALSIPPVACFEPGATSTCGSVQPSVETPASSPHVTGVGGTNLVTTISSTSLDSKYVSEQAFDDPLEGDIFYGTPATGSVWGSGGGDSIYYPKPAFQLLADTGSNYRTVPDLSLHMGGCPFGAVQPCGPDRSADIVAIDGNYYGVIGTSASAPDFAGLTALKIQRTGSRLGNENPEIYALALQNSGALKVFRDDIPGYNGLYATRKGYNRVLGNGTVIGINFLLAPFAPTAGTPQTPSNP
jgi:subtilase family serine protease